MIVALEYMIQLPNAEDEAEFIMSMRSSIGSSQSGQLFGATVPIVQINIFLIN